MRGFLVFGLCCLSHFVFTIACFGQDNEKCEKAIYTNQSSLVVKKILAKELIIDERPSFNNPAAVRNANVALAGTINRYEGVRRDHAIANFALRSTFDMFKWSLTLASYGSGPLAPIVSSGIHYVSSKTLDKVADMAENEMTETSRNVLKAGLKSYLDDNGVASLENSNPQEIIETLERNGYFPGMAVDEQIDENGLQVVRGFMITELAKMDELILREQLELSQDVDFVQQEVTNLKALGQSLWNSIEKNNQRLDRINTNMALINENLQTQINANRENILANRSDIEYLQSFMFGKMSAKERKNALENGFYRNMDPERRKRLQEQIEMEAQREQVIQDMGQYLNSAGEILNIASNFGLESPLLEDAGSLMQAGTHILNGVDALSSPMGWLSAASSFSNVLSIGKPDVAGKRHEQVVNLLKTVLQNQEEMKRKLDSIAINQVRMMQNQMYIYEAVVNLSIQVQKNHEILMETLSQIQDDILVIKSGIAELVKREYKSCYPPLEDIRTVSLNSETPFEDLPYRELQKLYRDYSNASRNDIIPCLQGLRTVLGFGDGLARAAFTSEFYIDEDIKEMEVFLDKYWRPQLNVLKRILDKYEVDFQQFFLLSIGPNLLVSKIDTLKSSLDDFQLPKRLRSFEKYFDRHGVELTSKYYSAEATFEIIDLFRKYFIFNETLDYSNGSSIKNTSINIPDIKSIDQLIEYSEFDYALFGDLERAMLRLDILIFQQNLISGAPLLPYYYKILFESEGGELRDQLLKLMRNNSILKSNFIKYFIWKRLQENNQSNLQYHFAINSQGSEDPWYLESILGDIGSGEFKRIDSFESNGSSGMDSLKAEKVSSWFLEIKADSIEINDESSAPVQIQLPNLTEVETGHLNFTNELFQAIEWRNTLFDYYDGMRLNDEFLASERNILYETLIYSDFDSSPTQE